MDDKTDTVYPATSDAAPTTSSITKSDSFVKNIEHGIGKIGSEIKKAASGLFNKRVEIINTVEKIEENVLPVAALLDPAAASKIKMVESIVSTATSVATALDKDTHTSSIPNDIRNAAKDVAEVALNNTTGRAQAEVIKAEDIINKAAPIVEKIETDVQNGVTTESLGKAMADTAVGVAAIINKDPSETQ